MTGNSERIKMQKGVLAARLFLRIPSRRRVVIFGIIDENDIGSFF
jgi:hypothetical protein